MAEAEEKFQFLTVEEFGRLSQGQKIAYLEKATARIQRAAGDASRQSLFKRGPVPRPRKKR